MRGKGCEGPPMSASEHVQADTRGGVRLANGFPKEAVGSICPASAARS